MNARAAVANVDGLESDIASIATQQVRGQNHALRTASSDQVTRQEVSRPLKESRKQTVQAAVTQLQELEQELEEQRARNAQLSEHNARIQAAYDGAKIEINLAYDRVKAAELKRDEMVRAAAAERDAAVHERVRLETIFGTIKNLMVQANFEIESTRPAKDHHDTQG